MLRHCEAVSAPEERRHEIRRPLPDQPICLASVHRNCETLAKPGENWHGMQRSSSE